MRKLLTSSRFGTPTALRFYATIASIQQQTTEPSFLVVCVDFTGIWTALTRLWRFRQSCGHGAVRFTQTTCWPRCRNSSHQLTASGRSKEHPPSPLLLAAV